MADEESQSEDIDDDRSQYGGAPSDIDAAEQTERAEEATDEDETGGEDTDS